ncbi:hypothetical protein BaRGS_00014738, partial [Batillaria attramentaria]
MTDAMVGKWESSAMENMDAFWDVMGLFCKFLPHNLEKATPRDNSTMNGEVL